MSLPDLSRNSSNMSLMINLSCSYLSLFVTARNVSIVHVSIVLMPILFDDVTVLSDVT